MKIYFKLLQEVIKKNRKKTLVCLCILLVMSILQVAIPLTMKEMISKIEYYESVQVFLICIAVYALMWLCYNFIHVKWYKHIDMLGEDVMWNIRSGIYRVLWNCEYDELQQMDKEYLKNVMFTDVISIYGNIILYSLNIIADLFMVLVLLGVSFYVNIKTTLILVAAVLIGLLISVLTKPVMANCSTAVNQALKKDNAVNNESVDAIELTRTNGLYDYYEKKVRRSIHAFIKVAIQSDQKTVFLQNLMNHYHQILLMVITGFLVLNSKEISAGSLVYYIFVTNLIIEKSQTIEDNLYRFMKNMAAFENVDTILAKEVTTNPDGEEVQAISNISFQDVALRYDGQHTIFQNVSFELEKGDAVLVKGTNGSGKSSILKMIAGLVSPSSGEILYDGVPFRSVNRNSLYRQICYLNQEELLLNESLQDYLSAVSHRPLSEEETLQYKKRVQLNKDYGCISDNGRFFSGGEKKKTILTKLLARQQDVSVILLDETEAGLDLGSKEIMNEIERELLINRERYIIVRISHGDMDNLDRYNKVVELG